MKVIHPITITDATLISSGIAEPDTGETAWSSGTTYAASDEIYLASTHRKYRSVQGSNLNHNPATDDGTWWLEIGGTNKWAMFDDYVSTASTKATSPLVVTIAPGLCDGLFLYGLIGTTANITITDGAGGPTVYDRDLDLMTPSITTWYDYYFGAFRQVPYFVLTDLPPYVNARITLTVEGDSAVACGMMAPGRIYTIGQTQYSPRVGIRDYSRKTVDADTGFTVLTQGRFAKTLRAEVRLFSTTFAEVHSTLESLRAVPCVWIGDSDGDGTIEPLTVYGFFRDFSLLIDKPTGGIYTIEIEGMV